MILMIPGFFDRFFSNYSEPILTLIISLSSICMILLFLKVGEKNFLLNAYNAMFNIFSICLSTIYHIFFQLGLFKLVIVFLVLEIVISYLGVVMSKVIKV